MSKDVTVKQQRGATLSPRQEQCLRGILELKSGKEIARDLEISPAAVDKHLKVAREKLGAHSSAEAARRFASLQDGKDFPYWDVSDLAWGARGGHQQRVLEPNGEPSPGRFEDTLGASPQDQPLTPYQTLLTIFAVSLGSIVGLLLLVACADGIRQLISN